MSSHCAKKRILVISDGKPGHENQSIGLVEALQRLDSEIRFDICEPLKPMAAFMSSFWAHFKKNESAQYDVVIGAGHRTHLTVLLKGWDNGAKTLICMKPSLPFGVFDLCVIPKHDSPPDQSNVISTRGVMNRIQPGEKQSDKGLILVGGPSKHHQWDDAHVIEQIKVILHDDATRLAHHWTLTTSRRTPDSFLPMLREANLGVTIVPQSETDSGWLPQRLAQADVCWVSEDSVSMIYEALTAGCKVGLIQLANNGGGRVVEGVAQLKKEGVVVCDPAQIREQSASVSFSEADRVANHLRSLGWV
jgi:mitochondrial fission protein ELM1